MACRSPQELFGVRWLASMMRQTSFTGSPRSKSFVGGMRRPSWKMSVAVAANDPGAMPPISARCAMLPTKAASSPSR